MVKGSKGRRKQGRGTRVSKGARRAKDFLAPELEVEPPPLQVQVFLQDPEVARTAGVGLAELTLTGEAWLGRGPTSARFVVVDRDETTRRTHPGALPRADGSGFRVGGGDPARSRAFRQVNVWATVSRLLAHLESPKVFGRRIPWAFPGSRLELRPHAEVLENAYYERESGSLRFGYFELDGRRVYTCLSHDVIAHEFGHAVLDGLKPLYEEAGEPDVAAFHEFFGDAVAMASALTLRDVLARLLARGRQRGKDEGLERLAWVTDLMEEWGAAYGERYIRSARNRATLAKLRGNFFEHERSEVLTGAVYDIFKGLYRQLRREESELDAVVHAADHSSRMIFRAVDYCPPTGLDFAIYAAALLRADEVAYPVDARDYRGLVRDVLRRRGIRPAPARRPANDELRPYDVEQLASSETDAYVFLDRNRERLGIPRSVDFRVVRLFETRKTAARGYLPPREIVVEFAWAETLRVTGTGDEDLDGSVSEFWCGGTLVLDAAGNVLHHVVVDGNAARRKRMLRYLRFMVREGYFDEGEGEDGTLALRRARKLAAPGGRVRVVRIPAARCPLRPPGKQQGKGKRTPARR